METDDEPIPAEDLWARALMPPQSLMDYRKVRDGQDPENRNQEELYALLHNQPAVFRREWKEEEKAYRMSMAAMEKARVGKPGKQTGGMPYHGKAFPSREKEGNFVGGVPALAYDDEGGMRADELAERLLREAGESDNAFGNHIEENGEVIASFKTREDAELFRQAKRGKP